MKMCMKNTSINHVNQIIVCDEECIPSTQDFQSTTSSQESYVLKKIGILMLVLEMIDIYRCVFYLSAQASIH